MFGGTGSPKKGDPTGQKMSDSSATIFVACYPSFDVRNKVAVRISDRISFGSKFVLFGLACPAIEPSGRR